MKQRQEKVSLPEIFLHVFMFAEKVNGMIQDSHETISASEEYWSSFPRSWKRKPEC
jgi:hypothetical protein